MIATLDARPRDGLMAKKKARGRPPLPEDERLSESLRVRLTAAEQSMVEEAATADGATVAAFMRSAVVEKARRVLGR